MDVVSEMYKVVQLAIEKKKKDLSYICEQKWPLEIMTACENMLRTTIFDEELTESASNEDDVLINYFDTFNPDFLKNMISLQE